MTNPKTLIIFLSLTGQTQHLAGLLAGQFEDVDIEEIELKFTLPKSQFWTVVKLGFMMKVLKKMPHKALDIDSNIYDQVLIGGPVWMNRYPMPIFSVLNQLNLDVQKVGIFGTYSQDPGDALNHFKIEMPFLNLQSELILRSPVNNRHPQTQIALGNFLSSFDGLKVGR